MRQYQEMVSELMGVYREHNFVHELNSQIPEANVLSFMFVFAVDGLSLWKGVVCELARKRSENMRVNIEVDAGEARMENV